MKSIIAAFAVAFMLSFLFTPYARHLAFKLNVLDHPKDPRKLHKKPIPYLGGAAIYASTIICMLLFTEIDRMSISIIAGGTIIFFTGLIDDIKDISAKWKMAAQILAAVITLYGGVKIQWISNPFPSSDFVYLVNLSIPATLFWIVGITNTINLIDGIDGLASGVAAIAATTLMVISAIHGFSFIIIECAIVAGASLGFLPFNFNPAKIFMGDTGALFLGYMLAVLSIAGVMKTVTAVTIVVMIFVLGIPIFDTSFAIVRRMINKKPIMEADKGHVHHRLLDIGFSQKQTVLILYVISIAFGAAAIFITGSEPVAGTIVVAVTAGLIVLAGGKIGLLGDKKKI
ncbi:UDP-GlcNAc:undecaprenyl-phosphate GlcNAc-1-phosphate transferase [Dethiosulfatibacter aminovorans DSM 17477]|uniref:UDP-GlcNAc:undecaprenyl-phosphate GlcNAc-1-phosphate transferase n=1 Tax=Dethiosulfatibacter aminovorans DSM 17477 TaxID=1121476 RepID=A0A1M6LSE6_9FIRM|nr:MraY family glycosyltransferase [Dethiosulfatibacter aminovorans]SHJ74093.1 UDP-GlcNAc:undecaprenyl-phosphate GlcNAc-1-phosphate transferase [Dethiosulfatibacter aminovorans DSM 17477]